MTVATTTVAAGLGAAALWGGGDFCGGMAGRKGSAFSVMLLAQWVGLLGLAAAAVGFQQPWPAMGVWALGAAAGLAGASGVLMLYRGLAIGPMSVVAPVSAVVAAGIPITVSFFREGAPSAGQALGIGLGLVAIWFVGGGRASRPVAQSALGLALLAGAGFGTFYVLLDTIGGTALLWPLVAARIASLSVLAPIVAFRRIPLPEGSTALSLSVLAGLLDSAGNVCFVVAASTGRLDVAAVLVSLYPASTVALAFVVLKERFTKSQGLGLATAAAALVLMTAF